jgi:chromosome segregation ATPase
MNDTVAIGKSVIGSIIHNHAEHAVLANQIDSLEKREADIKTLSKDFYEFRGETRSEFTTIKSDIKDLKSDVNTLKADVKSIYTQLDEYKPTMAALRRYLKRKGELDDNL